MTSLVRQYDAWHKHVFDADPEHLDASSPWYQLVLEYLGPVEGKRVLEVACGRGGFTRLLAARGARVCGADFSGSALQIAHLRSQNGGGNGCSLAYVQADAQTLPFASG